MCSSLKACARESSYDTPRPYRFWVLLAKLSTTSIGSKRRGKSNPYRVVSESFITGKPRISSVSHTRKKIVSTESGAGKIQRPYGFQANVCTLPLPGGCRSAPSPCPQRSQAGFLPGFGQVELRSARLQNPLQRWVLKHQHWDLTGHFFPYAVPSLIRVQAPYSCSSVDRTGGLVYPSWLSSRDKRFLLGFRRSGRIAGPRTR